MPKKNRIVEVIVRKDGIKNPLIKDIKRIFLPFNLALNLFLNSKYEIRNNNIYPNGPKYNIFASFFLILMNALCVYRMFTFDVADNSSIEEDLTKAILGFLGTSFYFVTLIGFTITFISNTLHRENVVLLILMIQTIYRSIDISKSINSYIIRNWICLVIVIISDFTERLMYHVTCHYHVLFEQAFDIITDIMPLVLDINIMLFNRILVLLRIYLEEWIKIVETTNDDDEEQWVRFYKIYTNILNAFNLNAKVFEWLVRLIPYLMQNSIIFLSEYLYMS
ncbi:hypothetical protein B5X24_HaOG200709 [Helicoverpa armigera]|uniref:Gustatory receptor n=1 Tax=Helicoverpa armigera TaxID=29058 RepID=A0A2W1BW87_HELAM|nr:hypothetical protein B5X24_HaOG200709 [Helicoverpa armigera]